MARYKHRLTGVHYRIVEPLFYVPWLYYCITTRGKREYVSENNLEQLHGRYN